MAAKASVATKLRELLGQATKADLDEIEAEIKVEEEKRDKACEVHDAEIKRLKANRKMLAAALGIEDPRCAKMRAAYQAKQAAKKAGKAASTGNGKPAATDDDEDDEDDEKSPDDPNATALRTKAVKVAALLRNVGRPMSVDAVATQTMIAKFGPNCLSHVLKVEGWFHVNADGMVSFTDKGDRAFPVKR